MTNHLLGTLTFLSLLIFSTIGVSQDATLPKKSLSDFFSNYSSGEIELSKSKNLKSNSGNGWEFNFGPLKGKEIVLYESELLSPEYKTTLASGSASSKINLATPFSGYITGDATSQIRITLSDKGTMYGYIKTGKTTFYIEPASNFTKKSKSEEHVLYEAIDVINSESIVCASEQLHKKKDSVSPKISNSKMSGACQVAELAIALDHSYWVKHNGTESAINQSIMVMNMVAGDYEGAFSDDIRFEIVEHFVSDCPTCDPWSATTSAQTLLDEFTAWGPTGFSVTHDIGQFWTDRDICGEDNNCGVAGLAWINALCGTYRYHILEDFTSTAWQLRVLVSHEMGHNFGSNHDASGSTTIMAPSVSNNTTTWSSASINAINSGIAGFTCFESCVIGACTEILSLKTSNCTPGTISTYDLTLEIRHGGGGTSSSFDVIVDGQSYTQNWLTSPQTVVITGLIADGEENNTISIAADDGGDSGCAASGEYDVPAADCGITIKANFNDCALPQGWNKTSTNPYSWNGGNPLVQFAWKFHDENRQFANYDDQANSNSLKTIDGTCMAYMDDDIINHTLYTGEVTLTSGIYDVSAVDVLYLNFDYNFHPFEGGGKGKNSSAFSVDVYDGLSWHLVLTDDNSSCPWSNVWQPSCTEQANINISQYIGPNLSVRFRYTDGDDNKWTGMVALDNVEIIGTKIDKGPCNEVNLITMPFDGICIQASDTIQNNASVTLDQDLTLDAPNVLLNPEFSVSTGNVLTVISDGCN